MSQFTLSRAVLQVLSRLEQTYQHQFVFGSCMKAYLCKCKSSAVFLLLHIGAFDVLGGAEVLLVSLPSLLGKV